MRSRFFGPLALCLLSEPAAADCSLLNRIDRFSPLLDAVVLSEDPVARFDLELAVRRLDAGTVRSSFVRSGRPELVAPVTQYISAVRRLIHATDSSSGRQGLAAGRGFVRTALAEFCAARPPQATIASATIGRSSDLPPRMSTDAAQVSPPARSDPSSTRFPLAIGASAVAALIILVLVVLWSRRQRPHVERAERLPCRYQTRLLIAGHEYPCMVIDFSRKGCKAIVPEGFPIVRKLRIVLNERALPAKISWRTEYTAGLVIPAGVPQSLLDAREVAQKAQLAAA